MDTFWIITGYLIALLAILLWHHSCAAKQSRYEDEVNNRIDEWEKKHAGTKERY